jgi:ADP-heptose:LPS heptosyltransferase
MKLKLRLAKSLLKKGVKTLVSFAFGIPFRHEKKFLVKFMDPPRRILLLNGAHIGDIVISTSIIPILRSAYPSAEIGFVAGSWSTMILQNHPDLAYLHCIDHWWHNRNGKSLLSRYAQYRRTSRAALREIQELHYDLALCIYPYPFGDFMDTAWRIGIPIRLGFQESLYVSLATATVQVPENLFLHQGAIQAEVLRPLELGKMHLEKRKSILPESKDEAIQEVCRLLKVSKISDMPYRIIHIGTGARHRELAIDFWRQLAETLAKASTIVFTGHGVREAAQIAEIIDGLENCVSACNALSWDGFVAAVRYAEGVYGVESMAGHVAGAVGTRSFVVYSGTAGVARWRPEGAATVLSNHLECAPCGLPNGCEAMACMRGITPNDLIVLD